MKTVLVKVQSDHLERLASAVNPIVAICELIWNSLDADAMTVNVEIDRNPLGGQEAIRVIDDGHGISHEDSVPAFENLGGSWKLHHAKTQNGRLIHGKAGKGRFRAFVLGNRVKWETRYRSDSTTLVYNISGDRSNLRNFDITEPEESSDEATGTVAEVTDIISTFPSLEDNRADQLLAEEFALYLRQYPDVNIFFDGRRVDPSKIEARVDDYPLSPVEIENGDGKIEAFLTIIEWTQHAERALYLCDVNGFTLSKGPAGIQAPGFNFSAYLKSDFIRELDKRGALLLEELHPDLRKLLSVAKEKMREHFRERNAEQASKLIDQWKEDAVYPYEGEPKNIVETAERQVFDVLALNINSYLPDFDSSNEKSKRFAFRLVKEALESSPSSLQDIIKDVLQLPPEKQEEFAELLRRTSLEAIINASRVVADRLNFLDGLEFLVFNPKSKEQLLERRHLHKIVADHTWLFGEEFNLTVSDKSLTNVLKKHLNLLNLPEKALADDSPVLREDGTEGIIDLMLSRSIPQPKPEKRAHLIVELKRPKAKIDNNALTQLKGYAFAIASDERFKDTTTRWDFWAVSNEMSETVRREATQRDRPEGLIYEQPDGAIKILVKTWGQLIDECKARLRFFQEKLQYQTDEDSALEYLRRTHEKYLPKVLKREVA
jgi:hypothetical protein